MKDYEMTFAMMAALEASKPREDSRNVQKEIDALRKSITQSMQLCEDLLAKSKENERLRNEELRLLGLLIDEHETSRECGSRLRNAIDAQLFRVDELFVRRDGMEKEEWESEALKLIGPFEDALKNVRLYNQGAAFYDGIVIK